MISKGGARDAWKYVFGAIVLGMLTLITLAYYGLI